MSTSAATVVLARLLLTLVLPALHQPHAAATVAPEIDLDATLWEFEADPLDVGAAERWYDPSAKPTLERSIATPGAWEAQGVGNATALMHHQLQGVGWYRKTVALNSSDYAAAGPTTLWLWIGGAPGGVMRSAEVFANGVRVGRHVGYLEPLEMDLTAALGESTSLTLAVAVDSRWNRTEDPLWGSGSLCTRVVHPHVMMLWCSRLATLTQQMRL